MPHFRKLLDGNEQFRKEYSSEKLITHSKGQSPQTLWVCCSDSRISPHKITQADLGELFIHRNIANQVHNNDVNFNSVLEYAVNALKVSEIVICGHSECGGVKAAIAGEVPFAHVSTWLSDLEQFFNIEKAKFSKLNEKEFEKEMIKRNVIYQMEKLHNHPIMQKARRDGYVPKIYGAIFDIASGELVTVEV